MVQVLLQAGSELHATVTALTEAKPCTAGAEAECVVRGFGFSLREGTNALSCTWFPEDRGDCKPTQRIELKGWAADPPWIHHRC